MRKNNPFCLSFGKEPDRYVERIEAYDKITETFLSDSPSINHFLIMGVRGSGKTVLMATIANEFRKNKDWVVISLNPTRNLMEMFAASLYDEKNVNNYFLEASISVPGIGIGVTTKAKNPITDTQVAIEKMISIVAEKNKRILVVIDDITKSDNLVVFSTAYQDLISKGLPVYLIMTGLYENVYSLQRDKRCSFLLRAEKVQLKPLSKMGMKNQYKQTFKCSDKNALQMATFTKGYSYAFQALGYIIWEKECSLDDAIPQFDERMAEYCYEKIWEDLSETEKKVVSYISQNEKCKTKDIAENVLESANSFSVIRDRLIKKGIIDGSEYGYVSLALPRFDKYVETINE